MSRTLRNILRFIHIFLEEAIESYRKDETEVLLSLQKTYFDTFYNWDMRMNQWNQFLESIKMRIEMEKNDTT